jgi:hypothetical protein
MMEAAAKPAPTCVPTERRPSLVLPLLAAVLVAVTLLILPGPPVDLKVDGDTSSGAVLNHAARHGLQFGTDLVYLYGPLGYLLYFYFSPPTAVVRLVADSGFCLAVAAGVCLLAWRLRLVWRCLLLGLFVFLAANAETPTDLLMDTGLLCWGLLCFVESGRRLLWAVAAFVALAAFGTLAKALVLFIGGLGVVLIAGDVLARGNLRLAGGTVAGFVAAILLGWLACGQSLSHFGTWVATSLAVAQGYSQSLGWEGLPQAMVTGLVVALAGLAMVVIRVLTWQAGTQSTGTFSASPHASLRRGLLLLWLVALLFLTWKHGLARGDSFHVAYFFGFMPSLALALEVLPSEGRAARRWAWGLGAACCLLSVFTLQTLFFPTGLRSLAHPFRLFGYHARCLLRPGDYRGRMGDAVEAKRREAQLPVTRGLVGRASVDVFGQHPIYALFNGLNYHPRPVFQSYVACDGRLDRLNEAFYLSADAPEYVMFSLGAVDRRFPPLEDSMLLRHLLLNYRPVGAEDEFLLLKRNFSGAPWLKLLREGTVRPGERISVGDLGRRDLWLEIDLDPTLIGRLRQALYQPPVVRLAAWGEGPKPLLARRRAPAAMLAAGFVASPLLMRNDDVLARFEGKEGCRPIAYSVELLPGEEHFWQSGVRFRVFHIVPCEPPREP